MVPGYTLGEIIFHGSKSTIHRAIQSSTGKRCIVKMRSEPYPTTASIAKLQQEYDLASELDFDGIVTPLDLVETDRGVALVLEDFGGQSLAMMLKVHRLDLRQFLDLSIRLSTIVGGVHSRGIIHKDIKPDNIIINKETGVVKLTDFGIASKLSRETAELVPPRLLQGTLAYISPEQTGRMNRSIDFRTDFYSLGATFYEILVGRPPFKESDDTMQIIHSHIAVVPEPPHRIAPEVPEAISQIVLRLLSKNAEDRYQSSFGLETDLRECLNQYQTGIIDLFELGKSDRSEAFHIPQKLYGREGEIAQLMRAFYSAAGGSTELLLVAGYSGMGKSSIVNEIQKPIAEARGNFIAGKYDQLKRDIPYAAIIQAFQKLIHQILTESPEVMAKWRDLLTDALGDKGQVIIDVIPDVALIIGNQPPIANLSAVEAQNRLNNVFVDFVGVFAKQEHPLALFLDDLQWADIPSLRLILLLMGSEHLKHLLILGAYRDNEVSTGHPLLHTLDDISKLGKKIRTIQLSPLSIGHTKDLVSDIISNRSEASDTLAALCHEKTGGNPFFLGELLKSLYRDGKLNFDSTSGKWVWNIEEIRALGITDNVVDLMTEKLQKLPTETLRTVQFASCIGSSFDMGSLSTVQESTPTGLSKHLTVALQQGLIIPTGDSYKYIEKLNANDVFDVRYRFAHDRVQQAAYGLIPEQLRKTIHLQIGRHLRKNLNEKAFDERIFEVVEHLNLAIDLIEDRAERISLARNNLQAAVKAAKSSAFSSALQAVTKASELIDDKVWTEDQGLAWNIWKEKASHELTEALIEDCERSIKITLKNSINEEQRVFAYRIYLNALYQMNRHSEGIEVARRALKELGIRVPKKASKLQVAIQYIAFRLKLGFRGPSRLLKLPENKSQRALHICAIIFDAVPSFYQVQPDGMGYICIVGARVCLKYGNSIFSPFSFAGPAIVHGGVLKLHKGAAKLYEVSIKLTETYPNLDVKARIYFLMANFCAHWVFPIEKHLSYARTALECALEAGSINWADYSVAFNRTQNILLNSKSLLEITSENRKLLEMHVKHKDNEVIMNQKFLIHFLQTLQNRMPTEVGERFDVAAYEKQKLGFGNYTMKLYYFGYQMINNYLNESYTDALRYAKLGSSIVLEVLENSLAFVLRYYFLLTVLGSYERLSRLQRSVLRPRYILHRTLLWWYARNLPQNFRQHYLLVKAEEARVKKQFSTGIKLYEEALVEAEKSRFPAQMALANELFGRFLNEHGFKKLANSCLADARHHYERWGAFQQVARLDLKYPELAKENRRERTGSFSHSLTATQGNATTLIGTTRLTETIDDNALSALDMGTAIKAAQAISSEIKLENLLSRMMHILIENAGAERGLLLLDRDGKLLIQAEQDAEGADLQVLQSMPVEKGRISVAVVRYVQKTRQNVVLTNASLDGQFTADSHIRENQIKSLLCSPIVHQGKTIGLVYLENNLAEGAFTPERLKLVSLLASQSAISLENASLYANLEGKVRERTQELSESLQQVQKLKLQQDADYFLTSLLIKPLSENKSKSENVNVQFLMKQKKTFHFRHWDDEIGGDLCMANSITLHGQKFTVFANADAMGKSMQGAGGALVIGSVFEAIIDRTLHIKSFQEQFPERWLKNAFIEMHRVFESFNGSMLVSLFFGLVDDATGLLYYISAEHPWTVLFRSGKASFIDHERQFMKLGFPDRGGHIFIQTLQLKDGDIVIAGSDGRDDLLIKKGNDRIMNEDEQLFLSHVEKSNANLSKILERLEQTGEIMDDLSLVRVAYTSISKTIENRNTADLKTILDRAEKLIKDDKEKQAVQELYQAFLKGMRQKEILQPLIRGYIGLKEYERSADILKAYIERNPKDSEALYLAAYCLKKTKEFIQAIDFGERLRLRKPDHFKNLVNLAEVYALLKDYDRSGTLISEARSLRPTHAGVTRKQEAIERLSTLRTEKIM